MYSGMQKSARRMINSAATGSTAMNLIRVAGLVQRDQVQGRDLAVVILGIFLNPSSPRVKHQDLVGSVVLTVADLISAQDQTLKLDISLEEAFNGGEKTIQISRSESGQGSIVTPTMKKLKINIPRGVMSGQKIRLSRQGHPSASGGEAGDLLLEMNILPHRLFKLDGRDLTIKCPVTPWEAALGAKVTVPTLSGQIELKVSPGVQSGQKMRLKGRGLKGKEEGDLFVEIQIHTPPANDDKSREFYASMQKTFDFNPRKF